MRFVKKNKRENGRSEGEEAGEQTTIISRPVKGTLDDIRRSWAPPIENSQSPKASQKSFFEDEDVEVEISDFLPPPPPSSSPPRSPFSKNRKSIGKESRSSSFSARKSLRSKVKNDIIKVYEPMKRDSQRMSRSSSSGNRASFAMVTQNTTIDDHKRNLFPKRESAATTRQRNQVKKASQRKQSSVGKEAGLQIFDAKFKDLVAQDQAFEAMAPTDRANHFAMKKSKKKRAPLVNDTQQEFRNISLVDSQSSSEGEEEQKANEKHAAEEELQKIRQLQLSKEFLYRPTSFASRRTNAEVQDSNQNLQRSAAYLDKLEKRSPDHFFDDEEYIRKLERERQEDKNSKKSDKETSKYQTKCDSFEYSDDDAEENVSDGEVSADINVNQEHNCGYIAPMIRNLSSTKKNSATIRVEGRDDESKAFSRFGDRPSEIYTTHKHDSEIKHSTDAFRQDVEHDGMMGVKQEISSSFSDEDQGNGWVGSGYLSSSCSQDNTDDEHEDIDTIEHKQQEWKNDFRVPYPTRSEKLPEIHPMISTGRPTTVQPSSPFEFGASDLKNQMIRNSSSSKVGVKQQEMQILDAIVAQTVSSTKSMRKSASWKLSPSTQKHTPAKNTVASLSKNGKSHSKLSQMFHQEKRRRPHMTPKQKSSQKNRNSSGIPQRGQSLPQHSVFSSLQL